MAPSTREMMISARRRRSSGRAWSGTGVPQLAQTSRSGETSSPQCEQRGVGIYGERTSGSNIATMPLSPAASDATHTRRMRVSAAMAPSAMAI